MSRSTIRKRIKTLTITAVMIGAIVLGGGGCSRTGEEGLIGLWRFDEGAGRIANDSSGNSNQGTIHGEAEWVEGISGKGLHFDGIDDYIDCGNHPSLNPWIGDFTIEAWIKTSSAKPDDSVMNKTESTLEPYFSLFIEGAQIRAFVSKGGPSNTGANWAISSTNVVDGQWHHIVGVFDRQNSRIHVYLDGVLDRSADMQRVERGTSVANKANLCIGGPRHFTGVIDEVGLYKRALSQEEIKAHYDSKGVESTAVAGLLRARAEETALSEMSPEEPPAEVPGIESVRFGITADPHFRIGYTSIEAHLRHFIKAMVKWKPDFTIDLGDFAIQIKEGQTAAAMHDGQLRSLRYICSMFSELPWRVYYVMGNHDVGWLRGGEEQITPADLYEGAHGGEDITKAEFIAHTKIPNRYYSFDIKGYHCIVLDGNNWRGQRAVANGRDGVAGSYWIDDAQKEWLTEDLAANREKTKVVFCHEELHHTPLEGSGYGGDVPFPKVGKEPTYIDNGWELREMFTADGNVLACFFGHKHKSRWTVYGGVHYITIAALHGAGSYAKITIADKLYIEGYGNQRSYTMPLSISR